MPCTHTFLTIHDSTRTPSYLTIHTRSPPPPPRLAVGLKVYVSLFTYTSVRPPTRGATWRHTRARFTTNAPILPPRGFTGRREPVASAVERAVEESRPRV